jgi:hypothetical protein
MVIAVERWRTARIERVKTPNPAGSNGAPVKLKPLPNSLFRPYRGETPFGDLDLYRPWCSLPAVARHGSFGRPSSWRPPTLSLPSVIGSHSYGNAFLHWFGSRIRLLGLSPRQATRFAARLSNRPTSRPWATRTSPPAQQRLISSPQRRTLNHADSLHQ